MFTKKRFLVVLICILLIPLASVSSLAVLSLDEAVNSAIAKSYTVKTAQNNLRREENNSLVKSYLPTLSASGSVNESADLLHNPGDDLKYPTIHFSAGLTWKFGSNNLLVKSTGAISTLISEIALERAVNTIYSDVSTAYYNLISLKAKLLDAEDALKTARFTYERTNAMYEGSRATRLSLLQAEITYNDSEISLETARNNFENALVDFRILTGLEGDFDLPTMPSLESLDWERLDALFEENLPRVSSVRQAEATLELQELNRKNTLVENRMPSLSVNSNLTYGAVKMQDRSFDQSLDFFATATVTIPLDSYLPWTSSAAAVKNSDITVDNAKISLDSARDTLRDSLRSCLNTLESYVMRRENLSTHLSLARENYDATLDAYEKGYLSYNDLNTARTSYDTARRNITTNDASIVSTLCRFSSLLELRVEYVLDELSK